MVNLDTEEAWLHFKKHLQTGIEIYVPSYKTTRNPRPPWLTQEIVREIRKKRRAWKSWKLEKTEAQKTKYEDIRKQLLTRSETQN